MSKLNIAIDGPSGAGKSTLAKDIAMSLGINYLDTGAMYRAVAYAAVKAVIDIGDQAQVEELMDNINLCTEYVNGEQRVLVSGENVMPFIRTPEMAKASSDISAYPCVRLKLVEMQREVANHYDVVLDGRDIGTYVLPNANYKFFLTADPEIRAKRRLSDFKALGINKTYDEVLRDIQARDANDSSRSLAPLKKADDAVLIDTTKMSTKDQLETVLSLIGSGDKDVL